MVPTPTEMLAQASAELLRASADWLWECDLDGRITALTAGRIPLPAGLAGNLSGHRFDQAGWRLRRPDGEAADWPAAAAAGFSLQAFSLQAEVAGALCTWHGELVGVAWRDAAGQLQGYVGSARAHDTPPSPLAAPFATPKQALAPAVADAAHWVWDLGTDRVNFHADLGRLLRLPTTASARQWWRELIEGDLHERLLLQAERVARDDGAIDLELPLFTPQGSRWFRVQAVRRGAAGPRAQLQGRFCDIHERRGWQSAAAWHEERYRRLYTQMPFPCWVYDVETAAFLDVNPAAEAVYGYSRAEFLGMTLTDIRHPSETARLEAFLARRARGEVMPNPGHWVHRTRSGEELSVSVQVADITWSERAARMVFVTDITAQRATSIEIKLLYECLEVAHDMIVVTAADADAAGNRPIVYVNRAFEQRTGRARGDVIGRDARLLQGPATDAAAVARIRHALLCWQPFTVELVNYHRDGTPYWVEMTMTPVADAQGWYHYWFSVERDISARKRAEQSLADMNSELERRVSERTRELQHTVRDLESFGQSVSHDLQNPLNGVRGFAEMLQLKHGAALPEDGVRMLGLIRRSAEQMHHIIRDLLSLNRIHSMQPRPVPIDVTRLCESLLAALRAEQPQRDLRWMVEEGLHVEADLQLLHLVFEHLLGNAWKFTGKVADAVITVSAHHNLDGIVISVADNGGGFDSALAQRLFGPFQRLHAMRDFEGNGFGLAAVARAVERLDGWVWADASPGHGARFHLFLPARPRGSVAATTAPGALIDEA